MKHINQIFRMLGLCLIFSVNGLTQSNTCATADVLCSLDELDGFTGVMPENNNTGEFPNGGLCPGGGTNQNITWFAFIAGSTTATLNLITTNCDVPFGSPAIQYGIYTDCNFTDAVICVSNAVPTGVIPINITGMQPGDDYFFFIDGDNGTFCDYEIEVVSGGASVDLPELTGISCVSGNCPVGGFACQTPIELTFEVDGIDLSIDYVWSITPSPPVGSAVVGSNQNTFTFDNEGTYEICVFAENGCTQTDLICYDLIINSPEAGAIFANPDVLCPNDFSNVMVTGYSTETDFTQAIIALDANQTVVAVIEGDELDFTFDQCGTITVYSYNFNPLDSPGIPSVGDFFSPPTCVNTCCDIESVEVVFEDNEFPSFFNPQIGYIVECEQDIPEMGDLIWDDNCTGSGTVAGVEENSIIECQGGFVRRTWTYEDDCGNETTHIQFIDIDENFGTPTADDVVLELCLESGDVNTINLQSLNIEVNPDNSFTFEYYTTLAYAENGTNALDNNYEIIVTTTLYVAVINKCNCRGIAEINIVAGAAPVYDIGIDHITCLDSLDGIITINNVMPTTTLFGFDDLDYSDVMIYDSLAAGTYVINSTTPEGCLRTDTLTIDQGQEITYTDLSVICNINNTATDTEDDFFDVKLTVSNTSGATNNLTVSTASGVIGSYSYGEISFILPSGSSQTITIQDDVTGCFVIIVTDDLPPCSDDCIIFADSLSFICNNIGTLGIPSDDQFTISFSIDVINGMSNQYIYYVDSIAVGTYMFGDTITYSSPADSVSHNLLFVDSADTTCALVVTTPEFFPCSGTCSLQANAEVPICDYQSTTMDSLDDTYSVDITINMMTGSEMWTILDTGESGINGETINVGPFLISEGNQTLIIQDSNISTCTDTILIEAPIPCSECNSTVEAGNDWILTCGIPEAILSGISIPDLEGRWTGPNGFSFDGKTVTVDIPGIYYYTTSFVDDCIITDSLMVSLSNGIPQINLPDEQDITCLIDSALLSTIVIGGSGNLEYRWLDAMMNLISNDEEITVFQPGNYFLVIYDIDSGCTSPATEFIINDETTPLNPQILADPSFIINCSVNEVILQVVEEPNIMYQWYVSNVLINGTLTQLTVTEAATVRVEAMHMITGCIGEATLIIEDQIEYPIISISPVDTINCIVDLVSLDASTSQMGANILYTWLDEDDMVLAMNTNSIDVTSAGTYYLELVDANNNCTNRDTIEVFAKLELPIVQLEESITIPCDEENVELSVSVSNGNYTLDWSTDDGNIASEVNGQQITVTSEGLYIVEVMDPNNQCVILDSIVVSTFDQITGLETIIQDESCEESNNGSINIVSTQGGVAPYMFSLDGEEIDQNMIDDLSQGSYEILITDNNGCTFINNLSIGLDQPFEIEMISDITIFQNETSLITASVNINTQEIESIIWMPSEGLSCDSCLMTTVTAGLGDVTYTLGVTDVYGCYAEQSLLVISETILVINTPNVIAIKNSNSDNSFFTIYATKPATISEMEIYDRWGNLIFNIEGIPTSEPTLGWNGTYKGKDVNSGVYVYRYSLTTEDGEIITNIGDVTVIR